MSGSAPAQSAHYVARIEPDDVARFSAAVGYRDPPADRVPATFPMLLLARSVAADRLRELAAAEGGSLVHVSQSFDYRRRLRTGETVECRVELGWESEGGKDRGVIVLEMRDPQGTAIGRAESRFVIVRAMR